MLMRTNALVVTLIRKETLDIQWRRWTNYDKATYNPHNISIAGPTQKRQKHTDKLDILDIRK